ncbi:gamma-glutamylcyclotransferase-like isoform X2 [Teleopsis dalmanni]|nr:gamma-glutamylcyclotransferase-like isoform X2 [Teleopsis dalmanni]
MASKFFYFGFGSNMLAKRIHIQNPTAERIGPGKLENYRLDFFSKSRNWNGAPATIVPCCEENVYGSIWEIDMCNMKDLDDQEGVAQGIYVPISVSVLSLNTKTPVCCRAYHLANQPMTNLSKAPADCIPFNRQPSKTYLKTLVKGAIETGIDDDYVKWLRTIKHNGNTVEKFENDLELAEVELCTN